MSKQTELLRARLQTAHDGGVFDGVALIARGDQVLYQGAWGEADREHRLPHRLETPFPICSITKQFTALLVMQQVAAGTIAVDAPVAKYVRTFRGGGQGDGITVRHLLMHTSGLPQFDEIPGILHDVKPGFTNAGEMTSTFANGKLLSEPGATFRYNNLDYIVLASLLETLTQRPYARLLDEQILRPLQLRGTGLVSEKRPRQVIGHEKKDGSVLPEMPPYRLENFGAAGAMYSTANDLLTWNRALDNDRLLPRQFREIMFTPDAAKGYTAFGTWVYGYQPYGGKTPVLYERQGGIGGIFCQNLRVPEDEISIILLTNTDAADLAAYTGKSLTCDLLRILYVA